jgi:hypothetical protein
VHSLSAQPRVRDHLLQGRRWSKLVGLCGTLRVRGIENPGRQTKRLFTHCYVAGDARGAVRTVVFGAVMADAAMLDAVLELDVLGKEWVESGRRG